MKLNNKITDADPKKPHSSEMVVKIKSVSCSGTNFPLVWVPFKKGDKRAAHEIPDSERDYYLERKYPSFGNLAPRDIASRSAKEACDSGRGVGDSGLGVYLDFRDAIKSYGEDKIKERYGNLFHMYQKITNTTLSLCFA